ncbi:MAG: BBP7 family outer membrane beta-barrel protein [Gemmataceae bacterium]
MRTVVVASVSLLLASAGLSLGQALPNPTAEQLSLPHVTEAPPPPKPIPMSGRFTETAKPATVVDAPAPSPAAPVVAHPTGCCGAGDSCGPPYTVWASVEYLYWWTRPDRVPPLVTVGTQASRGIIGEPGTSTLIGDSGLGGIPHWGVRLTLGAWLDEEMLVGLEGNYFVTDSRSAQYANGATDVAGAPVIARPFFNINRNANDTEVVAFPGLIGGNVVINTSTRMDGAELNALQNLCCGPDFRLDLLSGFRYFEVDEGLGITENLLVDATFPAGAGNTIVVSDLFGTKNRLYAMQFGLRGEKRWDDFFVQGQAKLAVGSNHETVIVAGTTALTPPGGAANVQTGGLLALPTNIGRFHHDQFAILPEFNIKVGYQVSEALRVYLGYDLLYLSDLARPSEQIDQVVNPSQLPTSAGPSPLTGPARPFFTFVNKDFWAQGVNLGMEFHY